MNTDKACIDKYISEKPEAIQALLNQVADAIRQVLPEAEERISWNMPTFWRDHNIIHFAAFKKHLGIYPGPDAIVYFAKELSPYKTSKGAIQFPYDQEVPLHLIQDIALWCYKNEKHH